MTGDVMTRAGRAAAYTVLAVLGAAAGALGSFAQAAYVPAGLLVSLAGAGGVFVAGGRLMRAKAGALVPAAGWLLTTFYLAGSTRPEGDWVFSSGVVSYLYLFGGSIIGVTVAMQPWGGPPGPLLLSGEKLPSGRR